MEEEKGDGLEPFSCRLEAEQISFIKDLVKRRVLGNKKSAVVRALLNYAIQDMAKTEFIQKYRQMRDAVRKG